MQVRSHSWITCTDYTKKNDYMYDVEKCRGWPRAANKNLLKTKVFAQDTGFDKKPSESNPCQASRNDDANYDAGHPMAVYYPGQQVVLAHPMKNHGADTCTNIYIPDNGNYIYRGSRNSDDDPPFSEFKRNLVFNLGVSSFGQQNTNPSEYPKPGFQNAPAFCDKAVATTDSALGTYSFNVPSLSPGRYTFIWVWAFNSPEDLYSTCFEVEIVRNKNERNKKLRDNGIYDFSESCGGMTSNPSIQGNCNDGEDDEDTSTTNCPTCGTIIKKPVNLLLLLLAMALLSNFVG
uniref:uncharacterized protein LOC120328797 n=1 Tax=Styela clava TaxID=7725 RepID=UPI00193A2A33|nr:uncharacterized protein LOC120328797 [Styela clava]